MPMKTATRTSASVISAELEMREWSLDYFAQQAELDQATAEKLVNGREAVSPKVATALSTSLGGSKEFWLSLKRG